MFLKVHEVEQKGFTEIVVALCDDNLIGEELRKGFFVNPRFYKGRRCSKKRALENLKRASVVNAVGADSVQLLLDNGFVKQDEIVNVAGVPHAQVFVLKEL
jgi:hypothetical protein